MQRIVFALTSHNRKGNTDQPTGFYLPEAAHPWVIFEAAGHAIDFISTQGGAAPMDGANDPDPISQCLLDNAPAMAKIRNTLRPEQVNARDYDAILFVGGHGTMWDFPDNEALAQLGAAIYEAGGVVGAVCHGPAGLVNLKLSNGRYLVEGKRLAAFTDEEERAVNLHGIVPFLLASTLQERGAIHVAAPNWVANTVIDERLVTGQNPASAGGVALAMKDLIEKSRINAKK